MNGGATRKPAEIYLDDFRDVPGDVQCALELVRALDVRLREVADDARGAELGALAAMQRKGRAARDQARRLARRARALQAQCIAIADEKLRLASGAYQTVDVQVRRLDLDLRRLDADGATMRNAHGVPIPVHAQQGGRRRDRRRSRSRSRAGPDGVGGADGSNTVVELPVDPNEPVYCLCRQASYGQMIGCENPECLLEWFHLRCVGLSTANLPKGGWLCPRCGSGRKRRRK